MLFCCQLYGQLNGQSELCNNDNAADLPCGNVHSAHCAGKVTGMGLGSNPGLVFVSKLLMHIL